MARLSTETYKPNRFVFETTLACNLRCRHCGSRAGNARSDELELAEIRNLFGQAKELGCQKVALSGGEPMMRPDWLDVIHAGNSAGLHVAMITNGLAFDRHAASEAYRAGLRNVGLSVDGIGSTHDQIRGKCGHFKVITEAMRTAREAGISFTMITTLFSVNAGELNELYELARDNGAFSWQVQTCFNMGNFIDFPNLKLHPHQLLEIERQLGELIQRGEQRVAVCNSLGYFGPNESVLRRYYNSESFKGCAAGVRTFGVESNGNVKGCLSLMAGCIDQDHDYSEGNLRDEGLADIWRRPGAFAYNRDWSVDDLQGFCRTCAHVDLCQGGCQTNLVTYGDGVDNPLCVHRIIEEEQQRNKSIPRQVAQAAAFALAAVLGGSPQAACEDDGGGDADADSDTDADSDGYDVDTDADTDTDTSTDTSTDTDADTDSDSDGYDVDTDVDSDSDIDTGTDSAT